MKNPDELAPGVVDKKYEGTLSVESQEVVKVVVSRLMEVGGYDAAACVAGYFERQLPQDYVISTVLKLMLLDSGVSLDDLKDL